MRGDTCIVFLKACVNGAREPREHGALPVTADELARDARRVAAAGAQAIHLHVKNDQGVDTFDAVLTDAAVRAVRAAVPGLRIGVTTGAWAAPDPLERSAAIRRWTMQPDFASVNWHEEGAEQIARTLLERGIGVEAGLWHAEAVTAWLDSPLRSRCFRVLVELPDGLDAAETVAEADRLVRMIDGRQTQILLHGEGSSCWAAIEYAGSRRLATRIGLEDTLSMTGGSVAVDNASLVRAARELLTATE